MNSKAERVEKLIPAIVAQVESQGGTVTKTKLLMLIYLFDIEWYRTHGETFTGWDWRYDPIIHHGVP